VGRGPTLLFLLKCREGNLRKTPRTDPEEGFKIASIKLNAATVATLGIVHVLFL
jgi:hypothetical protein